MASRVVFYSDKHSIFRVSREDAASGDGMTRFGRALSELNIEILCANTSQAKGRVERAHHTLQDRLVKEPRLAGISTIEAANAFLPAFVQTYNARFAKTPARDRDLHWPIARALWQQHCLEVASRLRHVGVVDEMRRTYRHHGRQREAPRRIATFRHATLRVAPHRYATLEPLGKPGGLRAFSADGPLKRLWLRDGRCEVAKVNSSRPARTQRLPHLTTSTGPSSEHGTFGSM